MIYSNIIEKKSLRDTQIQTMDELKNYFWSLWFEYRN